MAPLLAQAQQLIGAAFDDEACPGLTLVMSAAPSRIAIAAWAISECAGNPNTTEDDFRALYVATQNSLLTQVQRKLRDIRAAAGQRPLKDRVFEVRGRQLPRLHLANFATINTLVRAGDRFPTDSIEMLVLDERTANEMTRLRPFTRQANPLFTLVITSHQPGAAWPWTHLGEPKHIQE